MSPTSPLGKTKELVADNLAGLPGFQVLCGVDGEVDPTAAAKDKIWFSSRPVLNVTSWRENTDVLDEYTGAVVWGAANNAFRMRRTASERFECGYSVNLRIDTRLPESVLVDGKVVRGLALEWLEETSSQLFFDFAKAAYANGLNVSQLLNYVTDVGDPEKTVDAPIGFAFIQVDSGFL